VTDSMARQPRRRFLRQATIGVAGLALARWYESPGLLADELSLTPRQTEGPFYPDHLPLDSDNDLVIVTDHITPAIGQITHLSGRVLTPAGAPIRDAVVEIWQVDHNGVYLHSASSSRAARDQNFQGFGRFVTGSTGEYRFRTIKPVPYTGRTSHIHVAIAMKGREKWTTQCYVKGEPQNERDGVLRGIRDPRARQSVIVDFVPVTGSRIGELAARFDIVPGFTPVG
jgi:protocatechuate 3,4-dioxygenase, beta subunit